MKEYNGFNGEDDGLVSVLRRFPTHAAQIRMLMERNENFRAICDDLACLDEALRSVDQLPDDVREDRRSEFLALADELAMEVERVLSQIRILPVVGRSDRLQ